MKVKNLLIVIAVILVTIAIVTFFSSTPAVKNSPQLLSAITGAPAHSLKEPVFAAADSKGNVFVADSGNRRVRVFNDKGRFIYEFGGPGSAKELLYPYGIGFVDKKVIVADTGAGALYEFSLKGEYVKTWLEAQKGFEPAGISVASDNSVYVTDLAGKQVLVFSGTGKLLRKIKSQEIALGSPQGLAVNKDGSIWVADGANYNIKLLTPEGKLKTIFDGGPKEALAMAKGLAVDEKGRIYVADTLSNTVRIFDQKGSDLASFGPADNQESSLRLPVGLSIDSSGKIYVADQGNNQVQVWGWK